VTFLFASPPKLAIEPKGDTKMKKDITVVSYIALLLAILGVAGCKNPIEPDYSAPAEKRLLALNAYGDMPLHIECTYESVDNGTQVRNITTDSTFYAQGWTEVEWAKKGSSFRLSAISKVPNGHVRAYVSVYDNYSEFGGKLLLSKSLEKDGVAVEITGTVP
jgi:hypothetical protein